MFNVLIDQSNPRALARKSAPLMLLILAALSAPCVLALEKFSDISAQVSFQNATNNGYLLSSNRFIIRHSSNKTQIGFTITNNSTEYVDAPYRLLLKHFFSSRRINLEGIDGHTENGNPYLLVNTALAPGETSAPIFVSIESPETKHRGWFRHFYRRFGTFVLFKLEAQRVIKILYDSKNDFTRNALEVLDPNTDFSADDFYHNAPQRLTDIAHAIHFLATLNQTDDPDLHRLLKYLNVYANKVYIPFSNKLANLNTEQADSVNIALREVANMSEFRSVAPPAAELITYYVQALSHFYYRDGLAHKLDRHLFNMVKLFEHYNEVAYIYDYAFLGKAALETIKTYARLHNKGTQKAALAEVLRTNQAANLLTVLTTFAMNPTTTMPPSGHPVVGERYNTYVLDWLMYAYSQQRLLLSDDAPLAARIDDSVRIVVNAYADQGVFFEVLKKVMYRAYLSNAYPSKNGMLCKNEFATQCLTSHSANPHIFTDNVLEILNPQTNFNSAEFVHDTPRRLHDVTDAIQFLAQQNELADPALILLFDFLNAFGIYVDRGLDAGDALAIHEAYMSVARMTDFFGTAEPTGKLLEKYFSGLRNLYNQPKLSVHLHRLMPVLSRIMDNFVADHKRHRSHPGFNKATFELIRSFAWLAYDSYDNGHLQTALTEPNALNSFAHLAHSEQVIFPSDSDLTTMNWFLWAMTNHWWAAWKNLNIPNMISIETHVRGAIGRHVGSASRYNAVKFLVHDTYLDNPIRKKSCNQIIADDCLDADTLKEKLFPKTIECSSVNIKINAQDMSWPQLHDTCLSLTTQAAKFHHIMGSNHDAPIIDETNSSSDHNEILNIMVFNDDHSQYKQLGSSLFNINTNNGGVYHEHNSTSIHSQLVTKAGLYAFEASWLRPEFVIWNLKHEFIHYLDGRYIKYGHASHFPSTIRTWWSEGLAEFLSWDNDNPYASATLNNTAETNWPSLKQILHASPDDSIELTYDWSYWLHRFMHTLHKPEILNLAELLKGGTAEDISAYQNLVDEWPERFQDEFFRYLRSQRKPENSRSVFFNRKTSNTRRGQHNAHRSYMQTSAN